MSNFFKHKTNKLKIAKIVKPICQWYRDNVIPFYVHCLPDCRQKAVAAAGAAAELDCIAGQGSKPWNQNELRLVVARRRFGILKNKQSRWI